MRPAADFHHVAAHEQMIVDVVRIGVQVAAIVVILEERIDAASTMIAPEIKDVERMIAVADIDPHLPRPCFAGNQRIEEGHLGGIGVQDARLAAPGPP